MGGALGRQCPSVARCRHGESGFNAVGLASGEKDAGRALQGIGKELAKTAFYILPLGGGQLKAFEGINTVANGGQFGYDSQEGNNEVPESDAGNIRTGGAVRRQLADGTGLC
ncbi:MAG: hypothetical protein ACLRI7_11265 [Ruthenibacterium lactatiformans]